MLAALIEELDRNGLAAISMENEAINADPRPSETEGVYDLFFRGFDSMSDLLWAQKQDAKHRPT